VSVDSSTFMIGCYNLAPGGTNQGYQTAAQKVVARIFATGKAECCVCDCC
jgi:uncharacterized membrane protein